jgi:hypothetical protein
VVERGEEVRVESAVGLVELEHGWQRHAVRRDPGEDRPGSGRRRLTRARSCLDVLLRDEAALVDLGEVDP